METKVKHSYTDLGIELPNVISQLNQMDHITKEKLLFQTRKRILAELTRIENEWFFDNFSKTDKIRYDAQMLLINELLEYGFKADVNQCMQIMEYRITELHPEMHTWFIHQKKLMGAGLNMPKIGKPFKGCVVKNISSSKDCALVTWCYNGNENSQITHESAILMDHLLIFMSKHGYSFILENQLTIKQMEIQFLKYENEIITNYIQAGWELVEL